MMMGMVFQTIFFCDKNEISKALSDLSSKIKRINQEIKGYHSIYEYNNDHPHNTIKTTILIAYNFCDENYREDQLSPIFENADKCGITIFAIAPFSGTFASERIERVVCAYPNVSFSSTSDMIIKESQDGYVKPFNFSIH